MTTIAKAGRYELLEELGRGAMGVVYRGHDPTISRTVAVKTMRLSEEGTGMSRAELIQRFQTEAQAAGRLTHPNIVIVYDAGEDEGVFYICMELVEGRSLQALLDARQSFPQPRVMRMMEQATSALEFAHQRNIVHRDIKPANLMVTNDDTVKVTDFGTAKILQFGTAMTAQVIGTPSYMSPEQVKGKVVDGRSDIFSLGVVLYELVTGEKPFPGENITTVIYKIVNEDPIPPRQLDSSIPAGLSAVITRALAKRPEARFQTCREFMEALRNYREFESGPTATVAMTPVMSASAAPGTTPAVAGQLSVPPPRLTPGPVRANAAAWARARLAPPKERGRLWVLLTLLLLAVIAFASYRIWPVMRDILQRNRASRPATQSVVQAPPPAEAAPAAPAAAEEDASPATEPPAVLPAVQTSPAKVTAAEFKAKIERDLAKAGLAGKVRVLEAGNTLTLSGKLTSSQYRQLLAQLHDAPSSVRLIDHLEYAGDLRTGDDHRPMAGRGEIDVLTDVLGALAVLRDANDRTLAACKTPCRFHDLVPATYTLQVNLPGYQPQQHALEVRVGVILEDRLELRPLPTTLTVTTRPPQAFIFINGERQGDTTPATLRLAPGNYDVALRKAGFEPYVGLVQLRPGEPAVVNVDLAARPGMMSRGANAGSGGALDGRGPGSAGAPASGGSGEASNPGGDNPVSRITNTLGITGVSIVTDPPGAQIMVDGFSVRPRTPAQLNLPPGEHTITLSLKGYTVARRTVMVEANQLMQIEVTLH